MKYDREWLNRVNDIKKLLPTIYCLADDIPNLDDRLLIKDQLRSARQAFFAGLQSGLDTSYDENRILQLGQLVTELCGESS